MPLTAWRVYDEVIVMANSTNRKQRSGVSPGPDRSSLTAVGLDRSADVTGHDIDRRAYELYLARHREDGHDVDGHDVDDWPQAEREVKRGGIHESR